ncbi:hypothetical protein [Streptomyces sp. NPDC091268]|uniref:hypothetical protein n=1 Tax=Streptomyces sp. NPDC091268 TaxID=3365979 RepID=UPI0038295C32
MVATGTAAVAIALTPGIAAAEFPPGGDTRGGDTHTSGSKDGQTLESRISYTGGTPATGGTGKAGPTSFKAAGNWKPPACWFEPMSAAEFKTSVEAFYNDTIHYPGQPSYAMAAAAEYKKMYEDGTYKNYNLDKADQGAFWVAVMDQSRSNELEAWACNSTLPVWAPNGTPPPIRNAVTPEVLAQLAYNRISVPETKVTLAPEANTKVNLPTWAWLDKGTFQPVSVTASLNAGGVNVSATTTAKPVSLTLKPGTPDARLHPGSGECAINADGTIGTPFTPGSADKTPPCGLTYLRSSGNGSYALEASLTWEVTWSGSNGQNGTLPNGTFTTVQNITVQEIQAINR